MHSFRARLQVRHRSSRRRSRRFSGGACSTGNIVATLQITQPGEIRILNHAAAMDEQGLGMVSSAAVAMF